MRKYNSLVLCLIGLMLLFGCKKEANVSIDERIFLSNGILIPGEVFCDEEFCYWLDPELCEEPMDPSLPDKGPADMKGRESTIIEEDGTVFKYIYCWGTGNKCGKLFFSGTQIECGLYLKNQ